MTTDAPPRRGPSVTIEAVIQRYGDQWILDVYDGVTGDPMPGSRIVVGTGGNPTKTGGRLFPTDTEAEAHLRRVCRPERIAKVTVRR